MKESKEPKSLIEQLQRYNANLTKLCEESKKLREQMEKQLTGSR